MKHSFSFLTLLMLVLLTGSRLWSADFYVGRSTVDFTPDQPVFLQGQMHTRISTHAETPLLANILALESREGEQSLDSVIFVALDICTIDPSLNESMREELKTILPEFDADSKLVLAATHTHTSLTTREGYVTDRTDVMSHSEVVKHIVDQVVPGIVAAWKSRGKGQFAYGLGHAMVAYNRRAVYADGTAVMYGQTNTPNFRAIEGVEDHDVNTMFFWDENNTLLAILINVSCPAQLVEGRTAINADFWEPVRQMIHVKYGEQVCVLGVCGAAGDMSPRPLYQKEADARMTNLRKHDGLTELARRIVRAVDETYPVVETVKTSDVPLQHRFAILDLPQQKVSQELYESFKQQADALNKQRLAAKDKGASGPHALYHWTNRVVLRYEGQRGVENPTYPVAVHVLRIGETALCTNPFELYTDFGIQMKSRSKATQTFVVQLAGNRDVAGYVPSEGAVRHGGYGAIPQSNYIGAEGGQILVEKTLEMLNPLFE